MPLKISGALRAVKPYAATREPPHVLRLDANEAPVFERPKVQEIVRAASESVRLERYPDASCDALRAALGRRFGIDPSSVVFGAGSDELIAMLLTAVAEPRDRETPPCLVIPSPTFSVYGLAARVRGWRVEEVPLDAAWDLDRAAMQEAIERLRPNIVFLATPNNPTAGTYASDRVDSLIVSAPDTLFVIDEAYAYFADGLDGGAVRPNVAKLRTLSKVGFASLRLGWLEGPEPLVTALEATRMPFNVGAMTQAICAKVLDSAWDEVSRAIDMIRQERDRVAEALSGARGLHVERTAANFWWIRTDKIATDVASALREADIAVRTFSGERLRHHLRVTVGRPEENDRLLSALERCAG